MRIGYSYWGVCADFETQALINVNTADGSRFNRHILARELLSRGHTVIALQERQEIPYRGLTYDTNFPDLDLLFLEWRWPTYKNSGPNKRDSDLQRQIALLEAYHGHIPIVVLDNDFQLSADDEVAWPKLIIAEPALEPRFLTRKRQRLLPWTDWEQLLPARDPLPMYGYIGNNYERPGEFKTYYFDVAPMLRKKGIQTSMLGNWLQRSPERGAPEHLVAQTEVAFLPRCNFNLAMHTLNSFICTTHVSKPAYYANKLIPPRYFEAISVNCPALTPPQGLNLGPTTRVKSASDVYRAVLAIKEMSLTNRIQLCEEQRTLLKDKNLFDVHIAAQFLEFQCL